MNITDTPTAWAHLPNAAHIDWVLRTLLSHPQVWNAAHDAARDAARGAARDAAAGAAWDAARLAAWDAATDAAWNAAWDATWGDAHGASQGAVCALVARDAAWDAVCALIAWDDASRWLSTHWAAADMAAKDGDQCALLMQTAARVAWELGYTRTNEEH